MSESKIIRFPKTIRMDNSDLQVFDHTAAPDEWAISGTFVFADLPDDALTGKTRQAFANGFLGTASFGWSTLVCVADISPAAFEGVVVAIADHFVTRYGAPDRATALPRAREEAEFAAGLCDHPVNTLLCVERSLTEGGIVERFRTVQPAAAPSHAPIWQIVED